MKKFICLSFFVFSFFSFIGFSRLSPAGFPAGIFVRLPAGFF